MVLFGLGNVSGGMPPDTLLGDLRGGVFPPSFEWRPDRVVFMAAKRPPRTGGMVPVEVNSGLVEAFTRRPH